MSVQFLRGVQVLVGPKGGTGRLIEDLRITFQVEKTSEATPNPAKISIYNCSDATRSIIEKKNSYVVLKCGYGENLKTLFKGDVAMVETKKTGPDIITTIEAGDGEFEYQQVNLDTTLSPGGNAGQLFDKVSSALGLPIGQVKGLDRSRQYPNGLSVSGLARDAMDYLTKDQGLDWSIQDGALQVIPPEVATDETVIVLTSETGLIGSPQKRTVIRSDLALKGKDPAEDGCKFQALLNPEIVPGRRIKVTSKFVNGIYKVDRVTHNGDTHSNAYYSDIDGKVI